MNKLSVFVVEVDYDPYGCGCCIYEKIFANEDAAREYVAKQRLKKENYLCQYYIREEEVENEWQE